MAIVTMEALDRSTRGALWVTTAKIVARARRADASSPVAAVAVAFRLLASSTSMPIRAF